MTEERSRRRIWVRVARFGASGLVILLLLARGKAREVREAFQEGKE